MYCEVYRLQLTIFSDFHISEGLTMIYVTTNMQTGAHKLDRSYLISMMTVALTYGARYCMGAIV